jgi:hypothetical protein
MIHGRTALALFGIALGSLLVACGDAASSTDGRSGYAPYDTASTTQPTEPTPGSAGSGANGAGGSGAAEDGGTGFTGTSDGGASGSPDAAVVAPTGAFAGAPAYVATTGPSTIKGAHSAFPGNNPAKQACLGCHSFTAAGSVFLDAAGTMPASGVEMRFVDANGAAHSAYTDVNGNFYLNAGALAGPAKVGVRNATSTHLMAGGITSGNCNSSGCHGGAQGWIHLP